MGVNVNETIIYSGLGIKLGTRLITSNDNCKVSLGNKLSEMEFLIID